MISDGDSSSYEAVKNTYVNAFLKDVARPDFSDKASSMDVTDEQGRNSNNTSLSLTKEQIEKYLVMKENCVNHVKKRVSNHLKTLKNRYSGFADVSDESSTSNQNNQQQQKVIMNAKPFLSAYSSHEKVRIVNFYRLS
jgi:hypothetical protein